MAEASPRFAAYVAALARRAASVGDDAPEVRFPGLTRAPWHDASRIPLARALEAAAPEVLAELDAVEPRAFGPEREPIRRTGAWDVAFVRERGRRDAGFAVRCPVTSGILDAHRTVRGPSGLAYLSRLGPGARIAPHRGPTTLRLRCHFGIATPRGCALVVGPERRAWTRGRALVFDDSYVHEAFNDSRDDRIVLIADLWHPELTDDEVALLEGLDAVVTRRAEGLARYWAANARA